MNCKQVDELLHTYWQLDEENPLRIEIEAHMFECEHCASKLDLDANSFPVFELAQLDASPENDIQSSSISSIVMQRIYDEETWFMPIATKRYQFSPSFRRNVFIIIASCLAMFSLALFIFVYDYYETSTQATHTSISGIVDVANAAVTSTHTSIYTSSIPVASISEPIVLQVVPAFPQYYVALSFIGIVLTLLTMSWFTRTRQ